MYTLNSITPFKAVIIPPASLRKDTPWLNPAQKLTVEMERTKGETATIQMFTILENGAKALSAYSAKKTCDGWLWTFNITEQKVWAANFKDAVSYLMLHLNNSVLPYELDQLDKAVIK